jgi:hypothetical protein
MANITEEKADIRIEEELSRSQAIAEQYEGKEGKKVLHKVCLSQALKSYHLRFHLTMLDRHAARTRDGTLIPPLSHRPS